MLIRREPITGPSAWTAAEAAADPSRWTVELGPEVGEEISETVGALRSAGKGLADVQAADFAFPAFDRVVARVEEQLYRGMGFLVFRNFPVTMSDEDVSMAYWGLGTRLGSPLPQNRFGDRVYLVRDETDKGYGGVRGSKNAGAQIFHTDSASAFSNSVPDVLGLLAVRSAKEGGESLVVSGHSAYNRVLADHPEALERLHQDFLLDRSEEDPDDPVSRSPAFTTMPDGDVRVRYNRAWTHRGHKLAGVPLGPDDLVALDAMDAGLTADDLVLRFTLEPGDLLVGNNHIVLHNRTAFVDHEDESRKRLLIRLWIARNAEPGESRTSQHRAVAAG